MRLEWWRVSERSISQFWSCISQAILQMQHEKSERINHAHPHYPVWLLAEVSPKTCPVPGIWLKLSRFFLIGWGRCSRWLSSRDILYSKMYVYLKGFLTTIRIKYTQVIWSENTLQMWRSCFAAIINAHTHTPIIVIYNMPVNHGKRHSHSCVKEQKNESGIKWTSEVDIEYSHIEAGHIYKNWEGWEETLTLAAHLGFYFFF